MVPTGWIDWTGTGTAWTEFCIDRRTETKEMSSSLDLIHRHYGEEGMGKPANPRLGCQSSECWSGGRRRSPQESSPGVQFQMPTLCNVSGRGVLPLATELSTLQGEEVAVETEPPPDLRPPGTAVGPASGKGERLRP